MTGEALAVRGETIAMRNNVIRCQPRMSHAQYGTELIAVRGVHEAHCDGTKVYTSTSAFVSPNPHNRLAPSPNTHHMKEHTIEDEGEIQDRMLSVTWWLH
jgi:hypothetical protein